jgi:hypothetical protein
MKKVIFTLNVDGYAPEITEITFPLMRFHARKIGADFRIITNRKWPDWPVVCEKFQCAELAGDADWIIFLDADTFVHPDCIDWTAVIPSDTVVHNGADMASLRHRYDESQIKDGRHIGTCGWLTIAPKSCFGIWDKPDIPMAEVIARCTPTIGEAHNGVTPEHLTDDFIMSRNIARHGYKHATIKDMMPKLGFGPDAGFFWHDYNLPMAEKIRQLKDVLWKAKIPHPVLFKGWEWFAERMK